MMECNHIQGMNKWICSYKGLFFHKSLDTACFFHKKYLDTSFFTRSLEDMDPILIHKKDIYKGLFFFSKTFKK